MGKSELWHFEKGRVMDAEVLLIFSFGYLQYYCED